MIATRRAPNGASRALSSLARSSRYAAPHPSRFTAAHRPATTSTPRFSSTTTPSTDPSSKPPPPPSSTPPPPKEESQQQQPKKKRSLRPLIYSTLFLGAGLVVGNIVRFTVAPPPLPDAGTEMDEALQGKLREELDRLPVVREFAAKVAAAADAGGEAEWVEVEPWGVGMPPPSSPSLLATAAAVRGGGGRRDSGVVLVGEEERKSQGGGGGWFSGWGSSKKDPVVAVSETLLGDEKHMVSQTLAAMKGYGPARRWVNRATRESVTVFWVGGGLSGWPGVAHGGALATAFCEAFGSKFVSDLLFFLPIRLPRRSCVDGEMVRSCEN